ncbi:hypothetical protein [Microvirga brassicacearum]|nr:hypothetical protein [Microvirga brassicacearum]
MTALVERALQLQRPLPDDTFSMLASGEKEDVSADALRLPI